MVHLLLQLSSIPSPGVGLENKRPQSSHFFHSKGALWDTLNSNFEGVSNVFFSDKEVEGGAFTSLFQNIRIHYLLLSSSTLLKGLILSMTSRNGCTTGAGGGVCFKRQKALQGFLKIGYDQAGA